MEPATMRIRKQPVMITAAGDTLALDPGTNPGFDISANFFINKKIRLIQWAASRCTQLKHVDALADLSRRQSIDFQVRPALVEAHQRVLTNYRARRFTDGTIAMPAISAQVIRHCEERNWRVI